MISMNIHNAQVGSIWSSCKVLDFLNAPHLNSESLCLKAAVKSQHTGGLSHGILTDNRQNRAVMPLGNFNKYKNFKLNVIINQNSAFDLDLW